MNDTVLILGGYGVFGARLAAALAQDPSWRVIIAGRSATKARAAAAGLRAEPLALDRDAPDLAARLADLAPFAVVDAAGPFQAYGADPYRLARASLAAGAHYLDLSDDGAFTDGIALLDPLARAAGRVALSGVSSVPALSSAAVAELSQGMEDIHLIEGTILPGNRAPRGLSVVRAILAQAGRPVRQWRGGAAADLPGWSGTRSLSLALPGARLPPRPASLIGAPDTRLFPARFGARSVIFRAGLELRLMHHSLAFLALPVRLGLVRDITPLARPLRWLADRLRPFGSDRGGMRVRVAGLASGRPVRRDWVLLARAGDGPEVPAIPARVALSLLRQGRLPPGARPCIADLPLADLEAALATHAIRTGRAEAPAPGLFAQALGPGFDRLAPAIQDLHQLFDLRRWEGEAEITRGKSILARLICRAFGFPPAAPAVPVRVTMERDGKTERWTRDFGGRRFRSVLRLHRGRMTERFGPFTFTLDLAEKDGRLHFPVRTGRIGPLPLPRRLLPVSTTSERVEGGRLRFDVALSLPLAGPLVHYRGWLAEAPQPQRQPQPQPQPQPDGAAAPPPLARLRSRRGSSGSP